MSKQEQTIYSQFRDLNRDGLNIPNTKPVLCTRHSESETLRHQVAKTVAASVLSDAGYRTHSEVETDSGDECDVIGYGHVSRNPIVVELENALTEQVKSKKLNQYLIGDVREVYIIDLDNAPEEPDRLYKHIQTVTGLE